MELRQVITTILGWNSSIPTRPGRAPGRTGLGPVSGLSTLVSLTAPNRDRKRADGSPNRGIRSLTVAVRCWTGLWPVLIAAVAFGQEIAVYPEFQRPTPFGGIIKADQGGRRRDIISPAAAQNGYASFFVVVKLSQPGPYRLDIAMNPESRIQADLYRVWFHKLESGGGYYPDALIPTPATVFGELPDPENQIPGQTAAVFWLDLWVPRGRAVKEERVRVEAQLSAGDRLDIYPLEVRILPFAVPDEDALDAGHSYREAPVLDMIHAYHRLFYEHRGLFHAAPEFAPALEGKGRRRRVASWDAYDRHYGPLFDGSAFAQSRRGPRPIRYAYLPIHPEAGQEAEFVQAAGEMERHFREKGWTRTRLEMFWRGDDASGATERQFEDQRGVADLQRRGDTVWFHGSAAGVTEPAWATLYNPLRAWMWGVDGYRLRLVTGAGPDPWFRFNGGRETMAYPGTKFGRQEPLPSLRLKIERNGLQDLALLKALEQRMGRGRLREELARLTNGRQPGDWWTNTGIDQAARPLRGVEEGLNSDWWPEIRRWIYARHMEEVKP